MRNQSVKFLKTWFLDPATKMNPNLNYAQMFRGPKGQIGRHTGVLLVLIPCQTCHWRLMSASRDFKCFTKIISGMLILKQGNCVLWTRDLDDQFTTWVTAYINWLETAPTALIESHASKWILSHRHHSFKKLMTLLYRFSNHGSFYYTQLASLKLFLNDTAGALNATTTYFRNQYADQISANGEQVMQW